MLSQSARHCSKHTMYIPTTTQWHILSLYADKKKEIQLSGCNSINAHWPSLYGRFIYIYFLLYIFQELHSLNLTWLLSYSLSIPSNFSSLLTRYSLEICIMLKDKSFNILRRWNRRMLNRNTNVRCGHALEVIFWKNYFEFLSSPV